MTGRVMFLLASTFAMGMFAGAYFYVTAFAPVFEGGIKTGEPLNADTFVIVGDMYGGCSRLSACASFRLINGRSYDYLTHTGAEVQKGNLPRSITDRLRTLDSQTLVHNSQPISSGSCDSYMDGNDYEYTVTKDAVVYVLDTCSTELAYNDALQKLLREVWFVMENPDAAPNETFFPGQSAADIFWSRFHSGAQ